jgi:hypothetical protein
MEIYSTRAYSYELREDNIGEFVPWTKDEQEPAPLLRILSFLKNEASH